VRGLVSLAGSWRAGGGGDRRGGPSGVCGTGPMSHQLTAALKAEGGMLAELVAEPQEPAGPGPAQKAASGPRTAADPAEYELLLEMIIEGSRLHYGSARVVQTRDPDLALLLGDQLYALGLARLAALEDIDAVRILAETIAS